MSVEDKNAAILYVKEWQNMAAPTIKAADEAGDGKPDMSLIDDYGVPWSPVFHSKAKTKTRKGSWRLKNGYNKSNNAARYVYGWRAKAASAKA